MSLLNSASLVVTPNGYKEGTLYSVIPNTTLGDMTVVRATTATRVNSAGLIELVPYNLLTYSEALTPNYTFNQCSITSNQTDPNGTNNAKRITNGGTANDAYFEQSIGITNNTYTWSIFVKQGTATTATIRPVHVGIGGDVSLLTFTFATQTITSSGLITTSGFIALPNGWFRIFCSIPITNAVSSLRGRFGNPNTPNVYNDWAFPQLEVGSYPTSYIPTTSAAVTRNGDAIYKTGISALIGQTEGTLFLYADIQKHNESDFYIAISNGASLGDAIYLYQPSSGNIQILTRKTGNGDGTITIADANWTAGLNKVAIAYTATTIEVFINGVSKGSTTFTALPTLSQLTIGSRPDVVGTLVGTSIYSEAVVFPTRLTNSECISLTT